MKRITFAVSIAAAVAVVSALSTNAQAESYHGQLGGNAQQQLCATQWQTVQSGSGGSFSSLRECASSRGVYTPSLAVSSTQIFAYGFHAFDAIEITLNGVTNRFGTDADGFSFTWFYTFPAPACGTITAVDDHGVHASLDVSC
jgi:hypothetical protein